MDTSNPVARGARRARLGVRSVCQLGYGRGRPVRLQVSLGRIRAGKVLRRWCMPDFLAASFSLRETSCRCGRPTRRRRTTRTYTCEIQRADGDLPSAEGRRHVSRREPDAGDFPLEFSHPVAADSAVVSGGGRADLHHAQVSAEHAEPGTGIDGGTTVWNFSPQGGGGIHYFIRAKRSIDLGVNARAHFVGFAGRPQPGRERQHSGAGGLYVLEMTRQDTQAAGASRFGRERRSNEWAAR